jgi:hypothetical protein
MRRLLPLLLLVACAPVDSSVDAVPVTTTVVGDGDLMGVAPLEPGERDRRRLDIDQLNASIRSATGFGWEDDQGRDQFERLASTLGKADYRTNTQEDRSPSLVFQKFLGDAAHSVCARLVDVDETRVPEERVFFVYARRTDTVERAHDAVEANIRHLLMRFHSRSIEEGSDQLDAWMWLHESASFVSTNPRFAWNAVCVGLITHPDFYTY